MAQSDARFGYRANLSRDVHDLSKQFGFTTPPGYLNPIFEDYASPGDTYYIKHDLTYLRTLPLLAPAMINVKVHYETFFVPFQMIYQVSENTLFSLSNVQSSNFNPNTLMNNAFPLFDYSDYCTKIIANYPTYAIRQEGFRLADFMDLNPFAFLKYDVGITLTPWDYAPSFFPWQILVYHTIFNYYYRLDDKTQFNAAECNWDRNYATASWQDPTLSFMRMHRRPWEFDYYTSLYRSPIVSSLNTQSVMPYGSYSDLIVSGQDRLNYNRVSVVPNSEVNAFGTRIDNNFNAIQIQGAVSTAAIRQMFANEKLAMITGRTRKNYDSQVLAHYGINVPHDVKHDLSLIARDTYRLNVGEVTSLSATQNASLGELAGKGWASSPADVREHKFTAPCHGFVMTIFSIEPTRRYCGGFGRANAIVNSFDFPVPEYDRLGNVPMFRYEVGSGVTHDPVSGSILPSDIIGWKEHYYWNKRQRDRVSVAFQYHGYGDRNNYSSYFIGSLPFEEFGNVGLPYGDPRPDLESRYYISPGALNNLFGVAFFDGFKHDPVNAGQNEDWNFNPRQLYSRDPFIVDSFEKVKKVSWMSKDGEPIYPY